MPKYEVVVKVVCHCELPDGAAVESLISPLGDEVRWVLSEYADIGRFSLYTPTILPSVEVTYEPYPRVPNCEFCNYACNPESQRCGTCRREVAAYRPSMKRVSK